MIVQAAQFIYPSLNLRSRFAQDSVRVGGKNSEKKTLANSESLPKCVVFCALRYFVIGYYKKVPLLSGDRSEAIISS